MTLLLRTAVWAACLPLLWPPGVCPHHGPLELLFGSHDAAPADDPCCPECCGADQSRLVEPAVFVCFDLSPAPTPTPVVHRAPGPVCRPVPSPHPSPPLYVAHCSLVL